MVKKTNTVARCGLCIVLLAVLAGILFFFNPSKTALFPPCPFHKLTGLYCPGCGSLRGLHQLLRGRPAAAFALNPLMVLALPFVMYWLCAEALWFCFRKKLPMPYIPAGWIWALLALIIAYGIARNIPVYPFTLLAPGGG